MTAIPAADPETGNPPPLARSKPHCPLMAKIQFDARDQCGNKVIHLLTISHRISLTDLACPDRELYCAEVQP
jgi:hypothetical protein